MKLYNKVDFEVIFMLCGKCYQKELPVAAIIWTILTAIKNLIYCYFKTFNCIRKNSSDLTYLRLLLNPHLFGFFAVVKWMVSCLSVEISVITNVIECVEECYNFVGQSKIWGYLCVNWSYQKDLTIFTLIRARYIFWLLYILLFQKSRFYQEKHIRCEIFQVTFEPYYMWIFYSSKWSCKLSVSVRVGLSFEISKVEMLKNV